MENLSLTCPIYMLAPVEPKAPLRPIIPPIIVDKSSIQSTSFKIFLKNKAMSQQTVDK